jgi:sugar lactone lactonase YvrE
VKLAIVVVLCTAAALCAADVSAALPRPATPTVAGPAQTESLAPVFRFRARGAVRFLCAFDSARLRRCASRHSRTLSIGRHVLRVQGVGKTGLRSRVRTFVVVVLAAPLRFTYPGQIAVEPNGTLLLAESGGRLARIDFAAGAVTTATPVLMPFGVATALNVIYFTDANAVRRIDTSGGISTVAQFESNVGPLAIGHNGDLYAVTAARVYRLAGGQPPALPFAGNAVEGDGGDGGPALAAQFRAPHGIAVAPDGALLISDTGNDRLRRVDPVSHVITTVARNIRSPYGVAVGPDGLIYVASVADDRVLRLDASGNATPFATGLESASSLAFAAPGTLYVTEGNTPTARVWSVRPDGRSAPLRVGS